MGVSAALIIAVSLRALTQLAVAIGYAVWRLWWNEKRDTGPHGLVDLLVVQAVMFEALFLVAAMPTWGVPSWAMLALVWGGAFGLVYSVLSRRGERAAGVMAATWALVATEISWVLGMWLFTYT